MHYTITGGGVDGAVGTVTPIDGATDFAATTTWTIERAVPLTQDTDYENSGPFPATSHETALDKQVIINQDTRALADRSLSAPVTDLNSLNMQLPNSVDRAQKALAFNIAGEPIAVVQSTVGFEKVLLAEVIASNQAAVVLTFVDWPAKYDSVELEVIASINVSTGFTLDWRPIDNGVASSTNLTNQAQILTGAVDTDTSTTGQWRTSQAGTSSIDDAINGRQIFTVFSVDSGAGFLSGLGQFAWRNGANPVMAFISSGRHTTEGTRWDGFRFNASSGNILSGTFRLWGLPKT